MGHEEPTATGAETRALSAPRAPRHTSNLEVQAGIFYEVVLSAVLLRSIPAFSCKTPSATYAGLVGPYESPPDDYMLAFLAIASFRTEDAFLPTGFWIINLTVS